MGVGNQRVVVREIALPFVPEKELRETLGFQVQEFIPMPVDDAVLDYNVITPVQIFYGLKEVESSPQPFAPYGPGPSSFSTTQIGRAHV